MKIEIIAGSARPNSMTKRVALHLKEILEKQYRVDVGLIDMEKHHLPPVQSVIQNASDALPPLSAIADRMFSANAFILVSPEYNGSFSPALKNFLDYFPKQEHKVFGIVTASPGALGGIRAALQLQSLIPALFGIGSSRMLIVPEVDKKFNDQGVLVDPSFKMPIEVFTNEFLWLARAIYNASLFQLEKQVA